MIHAGLEYYCRQSAQHETRRKSARASQPSLPLPSIICALQSLQNQATTTKSQGIYSRARDIEVIRGGRSHAAFHFSSNVPLNFPDREEPESHGTSGRDVSLVNGARNLFAPRPHDRVERLHLFLGLNAQDRLRKEEAQALRNGWHSCALEPKARQSLPPAPRRLPALHRKFKAWRLAGILGRLLFHPSQEIEEKEKESRAGSE